MDISKTEQKKTLVLGATTNPTRYAYLAANLLARKGHPIELVGIKQGEVAGEKIQNGRPALSGIDTVTLYVGPQNQPEWYEYILGLSPKRIIFNPGTENPQLMQLAQQKGIETWEACTLVLLSSDQY